MHRQKGRPQVPQLEAQEPQLLQQVAQPAEVAQLEQVLLDRERPEQAQPQVQLELWLVLCRPLVLRLRVLASLALSVPLWWPPRLLTK